MLSEETNLLTKKEEVYRWVSEKVKRNCERRNGERKEEL